MVGYIMRNLSDNSALAVPLITVFQTSLQGRREDVQSLSHVETLQVTERSIDTSGPIPKYSSDKGLSYSVMRAMPKPMLMEVTASIWTSNLEQRYMLSEQILAVFYPSFDLQNSVNALDWTALTTATVDNINFSSRSIPIGQNDDIDVMDIVLKIPFWLSVPAKVTRQSVIQQIVANINDADHASTGRLISQAIVTIDDAHIEVNGESITLLNNQIDITLPPVAPPRFDILLQKYGTFKPAISHIHLMTTDDIEGPFVAGTLQYDETDPTKMIWQVDLDTLPANTQPAISAVIDPLKTSPGSGLPDAIEGTRYLILNDLGPSRAWNIPGSAHAHDIIQFTNGVWGVVFQASAASSVQYVLNTHAGKQLKYNVREHTWVMAIDGTYAPGSWRLLL